MEERLAVGRHLAEEVAQQLLRQRHRPGLDADRPAGLGDDPGWIDVRRLGGPDGVHRPGRRVEDNQRADIRDAEDLHALADPALGETEEAVEVGPHLPRPLPATEVRDRTPRGAGEHVERAGEPDQVDRPQDREPQQEAGAEDRLAPRALGRPERLAPREHGAHGARVEQRDPGRVGGVDEQVAQIAERKGEQPVPVDPDERERGDAREPEADA